MSSPHVMRNRSNQLSGWLVAYGQWVLCVVVDPLHLYAIWDDVPADEAWYVQLPYYGFFALVAIGAFVVFARPRVELHDDAVVLRNIVRDVRIPRAAVTGLDDSGRHLVIATASGKYSAAGAENPAVQLWRGAGSRIADGIVETNTRKAADGPSESRAITSWRRPEAPELFLVAVWLAYPIVACAADVLHLGPGPS